MPKIRAATLFLEPPSWNRGALRDYVEERATRFADAVDNLGLTNIVWSLRVSLPPLPVEADLEAVADAISAAIEGTGVKYASALHLDASDRRARLLPEVLSTYRLYASLRTPSMGDLGPAAETVLRVSRIDPLAAARLAVDLWGFGLLTPYFPMSSNTAKREGIAIALLYTDRIMEGIRKDSLELSIRETLAWAEGVGMRIASTLGIEMFGVDASPSPWMDESVARAVETISGVPVPEPGTLTGLRRLNEAVWSAASSIKTTGFNEAMLAVAEDNVLKERVLEGRLRARDLVSLTMGCVAGVDMVVLPGETTRTEVKGLLADQKTVAHIKGRPLGSRLIIYEGARPGDTVELGFFGKVPVAPV